MIAQVHSTVEPSAFNHSANGEINAGYPSESGILLNTLARHPLRLIGRLAWLLGELVLASLSYLFRVINRRGESLRTARACWLQLSCGRLLRVFNIDLQVAGPIPTRGLLVSNHLSYLDIVVLGSAAPCVFVAKGEVKRWPIFGWFARVAGTIFVHREKRSDVGRSTCEIEQALNAGSLVVVFPEGTSSDGGTVLPFKSALLAPAAYNEHPLSVSFIRYRLDDGSVSDEVCYWRNMTLAPHLLNLLGKRRVSAQVSFARVQPRASGRKTLACELHAEVMQLKEAFLVDGSPFQG